MKSFINKNEKIKFAKSALEKVSLSDKILERDIKEKYDRQNKFNKVI